MGKRKTTEEFIHEMSIINSNIEILGSYINSKVKIQCHCKKCGHNWEATPNNLLNGHGCPKCKAIKITETRSDTNESFIKKAQTIHGNKYDYSKILYKHQKDKIEIICPEHGSFWQIPNSHLCGEGCPKCGEIKKLWKLSDTADSFIKKAVEVHGDKYDYSKVNYYNNKTPVTIICLKHGPFEQRPGDHLKGHGCPYCGNSIRSTVKEFIEKAKKIHGNKYDYSEVKYINRKTKVKLICPVHGPFYVTPSDHLSKKSGCPKCSKSHGELLVENYLLNNNVTYYSQYAIEIDNSINSTGYTYIDFFIPKCNLFIEYNGIQHYIPKEYFGGEISFEHQQKRDNYVREYCKENNIELLEIPYYKSDNDILKILNLKIQ